MQKEKLKTQKGITLIALIITIIVMLILVGVTVTVALQGGLFNTAKDAAQKTADAAEQETEMLQYEYEIASAKGETQGTFDEYVLDTKYNGLEIGDYVNYVEGTGHTYTPDASKGFGVSATGSASTGWTVTTEEFTTENLGWRVLGVNSSGELELISDNPTNNKIVVKNIEGFNNYVQVLNEMCNSLYGKGNLAKSARSLNQDDVFKLTGYNPASYNSNYGTEYTYVKESDGIYENGVKMSSSIFIYYDKSSGQYVSLEEGDDPVTIVYSYFEENQLENRAEKNIDVLRPSLGDPGQVVSLVANVYTKKYEGGVLPIAIGHLSYYSSYGQVRFNYASGEPTAFAYTSDYGEGLVNPASIRPVVTLKSGITVTKDATNDGSTLAKACTISE